MNEFPKFCDFHKRWFTPPAQCDYCEYDEFSAKTRGLTAAYYARLLAPHADCGHSLSTEIVLMPNGSKFTVLNLQDIIWSLEHEEWLRH